MKQIITISMEMQENKEKVELKFQAGINTLGGAITEEVANKIHEKIADITKIVSDAIERDVNQKEEKVTSEMKGFLNFLDEMANIEEEIVSETEEFLNFLDKMANIEEKKRETYEKATDEEKKKIDEFEKGLKKLDTINEKLDYTLDAIVKEILDK